MEDKENTAKEDASPKMKQRMQERNGGAEGEGPPEAKAMGEANGATSQLVSTKTYHSALQGALEEAVPTGQARRAAQSSPNGSSSSSSHRSKLHHDRNNDVWSETKPKPKAGYMCKICQKPGGEPDSHWFQLCPMATELHRGQRQEGYQKQGYQEQQEEQLRRQQQQQQQEQQQHRHQQHPQQQQHHHRSHQQQHIQQSHSSRHQPNVGAKNYQPPKKGYKCKFCETEGGAPDSHWFQQCPYFPGMNQQYTMGGMMPPSPYGDYSMMVPQMYYIPVPAAAGASGVGAAPAGVTPQPSMPVVSPVLGPQVSPYYFYPPPYSVNALASELEHWQLSQMDEAHHGTSESESPSEAGVAPPEQPRAPEAK